MTFDNWFQPFTTAGSNVLPTKFTCEMFPHGSSYTYDAEANASYLHIRPNPDAFAPTTHEVEPARLMIDVDRDGWVRGVESLTGWVSVYDLLLVLRGCKWHGVPAFDDYDDTEDPA